MNISKIIVGIFFLVICSAVSALAEEPPRNMVLIQGGCFNMGTDEVHDYELSYENIPERPKHKVCVDSFFMDKYEITRKEWETIMGTNKSHFKGDHLAVDRMPWEGAVRYCRKVGKRLPWEAEWEYAARAGSDSMTPWPKGKFNEYIWYAGNSRRKSPQVGTRKPNAFGLYDMMGGVWEWVQDWYSISYYKESPENNPKGPNQRQSWRAVRGLSWVDQLEDFRVETRMPGLADRTEHFFLGARCAKSVK